MKDTRKLLQDMIVAVDSIISYEISSFEEFEHDGKTQDAVMFNLIILGEAANSLSQEYQEDHLEIPWSSMIGTRNIIVHGYDQIRLPIIWEIIQKDLPLLADQIRSLL
jgi:uncharacterized protein with HEPN domain